MFPFHLLRSSKRAGHEVPGVVANNIIIVLRCYQGWEDKGSTVTGVKLLWCFARLTGKVDK